MPAPLAVGCSLFAKHRAEAAASFVLVFGKVIQEEQQIIDQITQRFEALKSDRSYQS